MSRSSCVVGVLGASGGLGASVLVSALTVRAVAAGRTAVAVDGVRLGGGLDVTMGHEQESGLRWPDLRRVRGRVDGHRLCDRLPGAPDAPVLSFDRRRDVELDPSAVEGVVAGLREACDLVVLDLPGPEAPLGSCLLDRCDQVLLLVGAGPRALAAGCALAPRLPQRQVEPWLCLRTTGRDTTLAEVAAEAMGLALVAILPDDSRLDADLVHGVLPGSSGRGALTATADALLARLTRHDAGEAA